MRVRACMRLCMWTVLRARARIEAQLVRRRLSVCDCGQIFLHVPFVGPRVGVAFGVLSEGQDDFRRGV